MTRRNIQHRRHLILTQVQEQGEVSVDQLAQSLQTSEVTIRKDLAFLERSGLLLRRYGGAVSIPQEMITGSPAESLQASGMKHAIAEQAASLIRDHNRIIVDSGRTTAALIPMLERFSGLVVMTNALNVANALNGLENSPTLLMTGGTWDPHSESFQGKTAEQALRAYDFDQLFIGADGLDLQRGTTTFNELLGLSRVMAESAREVIVLLESEKIGRRIPNLELPWQQISVVVTDSGLSEQAAEAIRANQVELLIA